MAKNSFLFGQTRGAVGDVVIRQREGRTVIAARNREIANPRTYAQAENRMRMAAVSKFYSPLSIVLQESFQNKSTAKSMNALSSRAIKTLQANGMGIPRDADFFPLPVQVSRGNLGTVGATIVGLSVSVDYPVGSNFSTVGGLFDYFASFLGIQGDSFQLTVVLVSSLAGVYGPRYFRVNVLKGSQTALADAFPSYITPQPAVGGDDAWTFAVETSGTLVGCAVIVSQWQRGAWRRTSEVMTVTDAVINAAVADYANCVADYMDASSASAPAGQVYLDGEGTVQTESGDAIIFDPTTFHPYVNNVAQTAGVVSVGFLSIGGDQLLAVNLTDNRTLLVTTGEHMTSYGKGFKADGTQVSLTNEQINAAAMFDIDDDDSYNFWQWLSQETNLPMSKFIF